MSFTGFTNFALSAATNELSTQLFTTNGTYISGGCINRPSITSIALTGAVPTNSYIVSNKGSSDAILTFKAGQTDKNFGAFGFTLQPYPQDYTKIGYGWYLQATGMAAVVIDGITTNQYAYTTSSTFKISYVENTVNFYIDDVLKETFTGVVGYMYVGLVDTFSETGAYITNLSYERVNAVNSQTGPYTVTFQPSSINFQDQFVSKVVYTVPGQTVVRNFTFSTLQDALTGATKDIDSRSNFTYTFYTAASGGVTHTAIVSATLFPSLSTLEYRVQIPVQQPRLTRNPVLSSAESFVFDGVHLLKSRAWGADNNILFVLEGVKLDNTNQLFLLSSTQ